MELDVNMNTESDIVPEEASIVGENAVEKESKGYQTLPSKAFPPEPHSLSS